MELNQITEHNGFRIVVKNNIISIRDIESGLMFYYFDHATNLYILIFTNSDIIMRLFETIDMIKFEYMIYRLSNIDIGLAKYICAKSDIGSLDKFYFFFNPHAGKFMFHLMSLKYMKSIMSSGEVYTDNFGVIVRELCELDKFVEFLNSENIITPIEIQFLYVPSKYYTDDSLYTKCIDKLFSIFAVKNVVLFSDIDAYLSDKMNLHSLDRPFSSIKDICFANISDEKSVKEFYINVHENMKFMKMKSAYR